MNAGNFLDILKCDNVGKVSSKLKLILDLHHHDLVLNSPVARKRNRQRVITSVRTCKFAHQKLTEQGKKVLKY